MINGVRSTSLDGVRPVPARHTREHSLRLTGLLTGLQRRVKHFAEPGNPPQDRRWAEAIVVEWMICDIGRAHNKVMLLLL
jgi:hypothetical protein